MKVYIARDGEQGHEPNSLYLYFVKPEWSDKTEQFRCYGRRGSVMPLAITMFPEIKNGECYTAEITLGEKV